MRAHTPTRFAAMVLLVGGLACAGNKARTVDSDQAAAARDTTRDSVGAEAQNPPGYRGMERDTAIAPQSQQQPSDTFLQNQGQGQPQDTSGYSGMERADTSAGAQPARQADSAGASAGTPDTSASWSADSSSAGQAGMDSTGQSRTGDTTGYNQSQDTTSAR